LIELHSIPASQAGFQDIELARISQEVLRRFYNLYSVQCPLWVKRRNPYAEHMLSR
jgi:hypothetical protein